MREAPNTVVVQEPHLFRLHPSLPESFSLKGPPWAPFFLDSVSQEEVIKEAFPSHEILGD